MLDRLLGLSSPLTYISRLYLLALLSSRQARNPQCPIRNLKAPALALLPRSKIPIMILLLATPLLNGP
jgi:hypothetical protein